MTRLKAIEYRRNIETAVQSLNGNTVNPVYNALSELVGVYVEEA